MQFKQLNHHQTPHKLIQHWNVKRIVSTLFLFAIQILNKEYTSLLFKEEHMYCETNTIHKLENKVIVTLRKLWNHTSTSPINLSKKLYIVFHNCRAPKLSSSTNTSNDRSSFQYRCKFRTFGNINPYDTSISRICEENGPLIRLFIILLNS